jgi:uncharacterized protein (DUF1919 family)
MTFEGLVLKIHKKNIHSKAQKRRKEINCEDFTIISNNCWGGLVYESYGLIKSSPTVGCYFVAEEFLKFASNFEYYVKECEMEFVEPDDSRHREFYKNGGNFGNYPIARVGDVEIAMLHYHSNEEAKEKWERRCRRINYDKLIFKLNDQNLCSDEIVESFLALPHKNKLFFTVDKKYRESKKEGVYVLPRFFGQKTVNIINEPIGKSKILDISDLINRL